ncbi:retrovirus-related pol polyprotein from transposon TNT 1-94 [Tanacetum coccineum]
MKVEESLNVTFDETPPPPKTSPLEDDDLVKEEANEVNKTKSLCNDLEDKSLENNEIINIKESKIHPLDNVIEPKNINEALKDESWVMAMQEELNQLISNDVWELVPNPMNMTIIGTQWVYRNKLDENGIVTRNKARVVAQGLPKCPPTWRKKLNHCNSSNEVDVNLLTPMPKLQSPINKPSQTNIPTTHSNHVLLQSHSLPLSDSCDTNVGQASIPPQSVNQSQLTQPLFPHLLINPHVASVLHAQTPPSPQGDNHTQPPLPPSPSREMLMNDINQLQVLSNLLAMHLSQHNTPS